MNEREELREMLGLAHAFELAAVVEVFDRPTGKVQALEPEIIQVNSRDLDKLTTTWPWPSAWPNTNPKDRSDSRSGISLPRTWSAWFRRVRRRAGGDLPS